MTYIVDNPVVTLKIEIKLKGNFATIQGNECNDSVDSNDEDIFLPMYVCLCYRCNCIIADADAVL